jgi:glutathione S-transferase
MAEARLITIPFSHYCEKARWALDATGLPYHEEPHAPVAHRFATRAVGATTVPVLVHEGGIVNDSTDIAHHADGLAPPERRLIPEDPEERARVLALEDELDETLGKDARVVGYWALLSKGEVARAFVGRMMPVPIPLAPYIVAPLFRAMIFRRYKVSEETARVAEERVRATFARLGSTVEKEGYLVGNRFTLADLTLAALSAPLLAPPEHPMTSRLTFPGLEALRAELSDTPVGRHVLRLYREHRHALSAASTDSA